MNRFGIRLLGVFLIAFLSVNNSWPAPANETLALNHVMVIDGNGGRPQPDMISAEDQKDLGDPAEIKALRDLVRQWDEASVKGDAATLDRLLADEFTFVGGVRKSAYLESVKAKSADTYVESAVSDEIQVQIYGNTAVVTAVDTIKGKSRGQPYENKYLYMDVWVKRSGRWQCVKVYSALRN